MAAPHKAPVIVNDRADLALLAGAAGVHVGQDDLAPADARQLLGAEAIVGLLDTHNDADRVGRSGAGQLHRRRSGIRDTHKRDGLFGGRPGTRVDRRSSLAGPDPGRRNRRHHDRQRGVSPPGGSDLRGGHWGSPGAGKRRRAGWLRICSVSRNIAYSP